LLPLGGAAGHKGFGLSLMIEALAGALSGHGVSRPNESVPIRGNGILMMAIDSEHAGGRDAFLGSIEGLLGYVTSPPYQPGFERITLPGEPERVCFAVRSVEGVRLDTTTWRQIVEAGESVGVPALEV
jgi:LDH2 family malate/lactate/ureidoglycolate dehydrogenase